LFTNIINFQNNYYRKVRAIGSFNKKKKESFDTQFDYGIELLKCCLNMTHDYSTREKGIEYIPVVQSIDTSSECVQLLYPQLSD